MNERQDRFSEAPRAVHGHTHPRGVVSASELCLSDENPSRQGLRQAPGWGSGTERTRQSPLGMGVRPAQTRLSAGNCRQALQNHPT